MTMNKDGVTDAMIEAGQLAAHQRRITHGFSVPDADDLREIYLAMLRASPPVSTDGLVERLRERNHREASHRNSAYDRFGMDNTPENVDPDVWQAADRIEQLTAILADRDATIGGVLEDEWQKVRSRFNELHGEGAISYDVLKSVTNAVSKYRDDVLAALNASATGMEDR